MRVHGPRPLLVTDGELWSWVCWCLSGWPLSRTPAPSPTSWYLQQLTDLSFFHVKTGCQDPQGPAAVPIPPLTQLFPLRSPPALLQPPEPHWSLTTFHRPPPGLPLDASIPWASLLKIHPPQIPLPCFIHSIYHHLINTDILCPSPHCFLNLGGGHHSPLSLAPGRACTQQVPQY